MIDLDTRMRGAGQSLRRASEHLVPEGPPRSGRRPAALAAAAIVLLVALAGGTTAMIQKEDQPSNVTTEVGDLPRLIPEELPPGLAPTGAVDLPLPADELAGPVASITVYGNPEATDPFAQVDLAVMVWETDPEPADDGEVDGDRITVRGHPGIAQDDSGFGASIIWEEAPNVRVLLGSHALDQQQLVAVAEGMTIEGSSASLGPRPDGLDGRLELVGQASEATLAVGSLPPVPRAAAGHVVAYQAEDDRILVVTSFSGRAPERAVVQWMTRASRSVEVRGHRGWVGSYEAETVTDQDGNVASNTTTTALWEESAGVIVVVQGMGLSEAEVLTAAESLRPVTQAEWQELQDLEDLVDEADTATEAAMGIPDDATVHLEAEYAHGTWAIYTEASDGTLCGTTASADSGSGACANQPEAPVVTLHDHTGQSVLLFGVLPEDAVDLEVPAGASEVHTIDVADGRTIYAVVIEGPVPAEISFVDADGNPAGTVAVDP